MNSQPNTIAFGQTLADIIVSQADDASLPVGTVLGSFVVQALLGQGGMGEVYKVKQLEPVVRDVALKLVRQTNDHVHSAMLFEIERQALASLDHPNIAKLFDAGSIPATAQHQARLYFAMEWVDGVTLSEYVRELVSKPKAGRATQQDMIVKIVTIMADVCLGAHHAHQRRVIHRDLKPNNVLVQNIDGRIVPKIIDFGIAVGDQVSSAPAGTPGYMAPEQMQAASLLDARADVHALGVSLIELLCIIDGNQALRGGWNSETLRDALSQLERLDHPSAAHLPPQVTRRLSRELRDLPEALRAIARKAMDANPDARYSSALEMATDLKNFLQLRPVSAMRASNRYIWGLFLRRHRAAVLFSAAIIVSLLTGLAAALYGLNRAQAEREVALAQATRAQETKQFLANIFSGVEPDQAKTLDTKLLKIILQKASDDAEQKLSVSPEIYAEILAIIAQTYNSLSEYKTAMRRAEIAIAALAKIKQPDRRLVFDLQRARSTAYGGLADNKQALAILQPLCDEAKKNFGAEDSDTLRCQSDLVWEQFFTGDLPAALANAKATQATLERLNAPIRDRLFNLRALGAVQTEIGQLAESEVTLRKLVAQTTEAFGPEHTRTLGARSSLAISLLQQKRYHDAVAELASLLPLSEKVYGANHQSTISVVSNYAGALRQSGQVKQSGPYYLKAVAMAKENYGADSPYTLILSSNAANYEIDEGRPDAALQRVDAVVPLLKEKVGTEHPYYIEAVRTRAKAYQALKRFDEAKTDWREVMAWAKKNDFSPDKTELKDAEKALADLESAK